MCRILFVKGKRSEKLFAILDALVLSAKSDPTMEEKPISHDDGFGYVLIDESNNQTSTLFFRTTTPIFESREIENLKSKLLEVDNFTLAVHARKISSGDRIVLNNHPYHFFLKNGKEFYIMHNGTLNKEEIEKAFNISTNENLSDTFTLGYGFAKEIEEGKNFKELLSKGKLFVKEGSALNTISIFYEVNKSVEVYLTTFHKGKEKYFKTFSYKDSDFFAFFSSTLEMYLPSHLRQNLEENSNSTLIEIKENKMTKVEF